MNTNGESEFARWDQVRKYFESFGLIAYTTNAPADTMLLFTAQTYSNKPWTMLDCIIAFQPYTPGTKMRQNKVCPEGLVTGGDWTRMGKPFANVSVLTGERRHSLTLDLEH